MASGDRNRHRCGTRSAAQHFVTNHHCGCPGACSRYHSATDERRSRNRAPRVRAFPRQGGPGGTQAPRALSHPARRSSAPAKHRGTSDPSPRFLTKHQANLAVAQQGDAELLLMGYSITDFWRNADGPFAGKAVFDKYFGQWRVANFGISGDTTQGVLYRLQNGEGSGFSPKAVMLMIGTNDTLRNSAAEIAEGIGAVVLELRRDFPAAKILLLGIFPRGRPTEPVRTTIAEINRSIAKLDDAKHVYYLHIGSAFLDANGNIPLEVMSDGLHPAPKGYEIWANAVIEPLTNLMGKGGEE